MAENRRPDDDQTHLRDTEPTHVRRAAARPSVEITYPYLEIWGGTFRGDKVPLQERSLLGRGPQSTIVLADPSVSKSHAEIRRSDGQWVIEDLSSQNGTFVTGQLISAVAPLGHRAEVTIGIYRLIVFLGPESDKAKVAYPVAAPERSALPALSTPSTPVAVPSASQGPRPLRLLVIALGVMLVAATLFVAREIHERALRPMEAIKDIFQGESRLITPSIEVYSPRYPAAISMSSRDLGNTPVRTIITPGVIRGKTEELTATYRLPVVDVTIELTKSVVFRNDRDLLRIDLDAPVGELIIKRLPPGIDVYLDGDYLSGKGERRDYFYKLRQLPTDNRISLPYGTSRLELRAGVDIVYRRIIEFTQTQQLFAVDVTPDDFKRFPLAISTEPPGATVVIDSVEKGKTPYAVELPLGEYQLALLLMDYQPVKRKITARHNESVTLSIDLGQTGASREIAKAVELYATGQYESVRESLFRALRVKPNRDEYAKANYYLGLVETIDGRYQQARRYFQQAAQETEFQSKAELGLARILSKEGKIEQAVHQLIKAAQLDRSPEFQADANALFRTLSPIHGAILVKSSPEGGKVSLDGRFVDGTSNLILFSVPVGRHTVRIDKVGFRPEERKVDLPLSSFVTVEVTLSKIPK